ncbi:hypothetical protein F7734_58865 [Scytonema sp. UIC 10036]|nr:hypothetical protein [Scytonema sp. UIC 10036]
MRYMVVLEKAEANYSAYIPDLPGCVATGNTLEEVKQMIQEAIEFHTEGMLEDGETIPQPTSIAYEVEVLVKTLMITIDKSSIFNFIQLIKLVPLATAAFKPNCVL